MADEYKLTILGGEKGSGKLPPLSPLKGGASSTLKKGTKVAEDSVRSQRPEARSQEPKVNFDEKLRMSIF